MKKVLLLLLFMTFSFIGLHTTEVNALDELPPARPGISNGVTTGYKSYTYNLFVEDVYSVGSFFLSTDGEKFTMSFDSDLFIRDISVFIYDTHYEIPLGRPDISTANHSERFNSTSGTFTIDGDNDSSTRASVIMIIQFTYNSNQFKSSDAVEASGVGFVGGLGSRHTDAEDWIHIINFRERPVRSTVEPVYVSFFSEWNNEAVWGVGNETFVDLGLTKKKAGWSIELTTNNPTTIPLYAGAAKGDLSKGTYIGDLVLTWDSTDVTFELNLNQGVILEGVHIHLDYSQSDTHAPGQLGYTENQTIDNSWELVLLPETDRP